MKRADTESAEASGDSTTEGLHRPRRSCRQHANALIEEQLLEEMEDRKVLQDQRTVKLKEKNKRAQQRFRERQKEKSQQATVQVKKLQTQVMDLRARTAAAEERCQLLEKLLKESEGRPLQGKLQPFSKSSNEPSVEIFAPYEGFTSLPEGDFIMQLRGCSASPLHLSKSHVLTMRLLDHVALYKGYVERMTMDLQESGGALDSPAAQHLQGLANELSAWCAWVNRLTPHVIPKLRTINMEPASLAEPPSPHYLLSALRCQGLTREQVEQMTAARRFCLASLADLMRERLTMRDILDKVIAGGSSWNNMYDTHPAMVEMQQRLARNLEAESHAFFTFMSSALRRVLNPIQTAALLVQSYPYVPNIMGVVACLSNEESGEGSDDDLLELDPVPLRDDPATSLALSPADSLGPALQTLWTDIFLT